MAGVEQRVTELEEQNRKQELRIEEAHALISKLTMEAVIPLGIKTEELEMRVKALEDGRTG